MANLSPTGDPLAEAARRLLGIGYLYPLQRFVVANVLETHSQIVVMPTGSGKSLCFQLPALLMAQPTLVLMPLLSLLADQRGKMRRAGIDVGHLQGGMEAADKERLFASMRAGDLRLVLATPEACLTDSNRAALRRCGIGHLVVDEAHCIPEWGRAFRPAYARLGELARDLAVPVVSAFTATASPLVIESIKASLFAGRDVRVVAGVADRPGIWYGVVPALSRDHALARLVRELPRPTLVFARTRTATERDARGLRASCPDIPTYFYHAGMTPRERAERESWFLSSPDGCLVATCAYGMGIDKPNIRTVVHVAEQGRYHPPNDSERSGLTGVW